MLFDDFSIVKYLYLFILLVKTDLVYKIICLIAYVLFTIIQSALVMPTFNVIFHFENSNIQLILILITAIANKIHLSN